MLWIFNDINLKMFVVEQMKQKKLQTNFTFFN